MAKLFVALAVVALSSACAVERTTEDNHSNEYSAGMKCASSGARISECAMVCDKMGASKAICWNGYFDAVKPE